MVRVARPSVISHPTMSSPSRTTGPFIALLCQLLSQVNTSLGETGQDAAFLFVIHHLCLDSVDKDIQVDSTDRTRASIAVLVEHCPFPTYDVDIAVPYSRCSALHGDRTVEQSTSLNDTTAGRVSSNGLLVVSILCLMMCGSNKERVLNPLHAQDIG